VKTCIVGAGAIGGWIGARLARAGHEVSLVARGAHLEALRSKGLTLVREGRRETFSVVADESTAAFESPDVVFLTLKAHAIGPMLPAVASLAGPETMVVPAINGLPWWYFYREGSRLEGNALSSVDPDGSMLRALDPRHVVGCVVHGSAEVVEPGVIDNTAGNGLVIGEPSNERTARVGQLAELLQEGGFHVTVSTHIRQDIWAKLLGNLSYNPLAALALARMNEIQANPELVALIRSMMEEAIRVAEAYGIRIPVTIDERIEMSGRIGSSKLSMHQDVEKNRPLEVDAVVGSVVELARKAGIPVPMVEAVWGLIRERSRHIAPD
jgi:2-dehydropantoate 2-reductase